MTYYCSRGSRSSHRKLNLPLKVLERGSHGDTIGEERPPLRQAPAGPLRSPRSLKLVTESRKVTTTLEKACPTPADHLNMSRSSSEASVSDMSDAYLSMPCFEAVEHSFESFPAEDLPTPTQESVRFHFGRDGIELAPEQSKFPDATEQPAGPPAQIRSLQDCARLNLPSKPDGQGRRNKKSVAPCELDAAFIRKATLAIEQSHIWESDSERDLSGSEA